MCTRLLRSISPSHDEALKYKGRITSRRPISILHISNTYPKSHDSSDNSRQIAHLPSRIRKFSHALSCVFSSDPECTQDVLLIPTTRASTLQTRDIPAWYVHLRHDVKANDVHSHSLPGLHQPLLQMNSFVSQRNTMIMVHLRSS
jgi:hypothetical protein